jgi:hypothetical protein
VRWLAILLAWPGAAAADPGLNVLRMTLYHEVGHAVIDQLDLPVYGMEENAADVFALALAQRLHSEAELAAILRDTTEAYRRDAAAELFDHWAQYMPAGQRLARQVCLWFGAEPDARADLARALGMPPEEARRCEIDAFDADAAWAPVLDGVRPDPRDVTPTFRLPLFDRRLGRLSRDVKRLNRVVKLPRTVPVDVEACGEANAYYYDDGRIAICAELLDDLDRMARQ